MAPRGRMAFAALLFGVALLPSCDYLVSAEDDADGAVAPAEGDGAAEEVAEVEGDEAVVGDGSSPENFVDSAKELQDKLGQLKELLDSRGEDVDPDLKARLEGLQKTLGTLGLDDLGLGSVGDEKALTEFLGGCVGMSMRRAGMKTPAVMSAMRRLSSDGLTKEQGKDVEFIKMVAVCITDMSDVELEQFKAGKLLQVPKAMEEKARTPAGSESVLSIDDSIWKELKEVAKTVFKEIGGEEVPAPGGSKMGLLALVPIIGIAGFLTKKFFDMQRDADDKKNAKKAAKQGKKQK